MMTLGQIYDLFIEMGIKADPRPKKVIKEHLERIKKDYDKLSKEKQEDFDTESLTNPYLDSRILYGDKKKKIKRVLVGIDMETPELLLAKELERAGEKIDLVMAHHPEGMGLVNLAKVMHLQEDVLEGVGVPITTAEKLLEPRISKIDRAVAPSNAYRGVDTARVLDMPYACFHTVADNQVYDFIKNLMAKKKPQYLGDLLDLLKGVPEFKQAVKTGQGPRLFHGSEKSRVGKIAVTGMTGGTEGAEDIYEKLAHAGVGTVIDMHQSEGHRDKAIKYHLNVVIAGHMASDSVGMNILLDKLARKGVEIIPVSGLIRKR